MKYNVTVRTPRRGPQQHLTFLQTEKLQIAIWAFRDEKPVKLNRLRKQT